MNKIFIKSFLLILIINTFLYTSLSADNLNINLISISYLKVQKSIIKIGYYLPCGAKKMGIFTKKSGHNLFVGILISQNRISCAALPKLVLESIDYIKTSKFKNVFAIKTPYIRNLRIIFPEEFRILRHTSNIELTITDNCYKILGLVLNKPQSLIRFGILAKQNPSIKTCQKKIRGFSVNYLKKPSLGRPLLRYLNPYKGFYLKINKIVFSSIVRSKKFFSFNYYKYCNELPIGLVVKHGRNKSINIGMLVARYYNINCSLNESILTNFKINGLYISSKINKLKSTRSFYNLIVKSPINTFRTTKNQPIIKFIKGCKKNFATVYSSIKGLSIGILEKINANRICDKKLRKYTIKDPLIIKTNQKISSLSLLKNNAVF